MLNRSHYYKNNAMHNRQYKRFVRSFVQFNECSKEYRARQNLKGEIIYAWTRCKRCSNILYKVSKYVTLLESPKNLNTSL